MNDRFEELYKVFPNLVNRIKVDKEPIWGKMNFLQMVEHLTSGFELSVSYNKLKVITPSEQIPAYLKFLMSDRNFQKGSPVPKEYADFRQPEKQSLEVAKERFFKKLHFLKQETETNQEFWSIHPNFGKLDAEQTRQLHFKHITHHFTQFALLP